MTKNDTIAAVIVGLILLGGGAALAATSDDKKRKQLPGGNPDDDGRKLVARANQKQASAWASDFVGHPMDPLSAAALARWAGLESSGDPLAKSRLNERGLMQAGPQSVSEGEMTQAAWDAMSDPKTSRRDQADIAANYVDALVKKASTHLGHAPADPIDRIWYAKLYHQRPVDVRDSHLTGVALDDARRLATEWAGDPKAMHRLRAANVVAWGTPTP